MDPTKVSTADGTHCLQLLHTVHEPDFEGNLSLTVSDLIFLFAGGVRGRDRPRGAARVLQAVWLRGHGAPHAAAEGGWGAVGDEDGGLGRAVCEEKGKDVGRKKYRSKLYTYN